MYCNLSNVSVCIAPWHFLRLFSLAVKILGTNSFLPWVYHGWSVMALRLQSRLQSGASVDLPLSQIYQLGRALPAWLQFLLSQYLWLTYDKLLPNSHFPLFTERALHALGSESCLADPVQSLSRLTPPPVDSSQVVKVVLQPGDNQVVLQAFSSGALLAGCVLNQPQGPDNHQVGGLQTPRVVKSHSCQYLDSEFCPVSLRHLQCAGCQATDPRNV